MRGLVRVVRSPRNASLQAGEILAAHHTDPGWIALFANASALVVERGSLLSHSAIVAREIGIPCVVGLKGATEWLTTGETIEVNGTSGTVRKIDG
jgi:pyruvate,water dikinase